MNFLDKSVWSFKYGKSEPRLQAGSPGWYFDLKPGHEIDYLLAKADGVAKANSVTLIMGLALDLGASIIPTGGGNPGITFILTRRGDDLSGVGKYADYRLWGSANRLALGGQTGVYTVTVPMERLSFTNVNGKIPATGAWDGMLGNMDKVGVTFGATFFGHGWQAKDGNARISLTQFDVA